MSYLSLRGVRGFEVANKTIEIQKDKVKLSNQNHVQRGQHKYINQLAMYAPKVYFMEVERRLPAAVGRGKWVVTI